MLEDIKLPFIDKKRVSNRFNRWTGSNDEHRYLSRDTSYI